MCFQKNLLFCMVDQKHSSFNNVSGDQATISSKESQKFKVCSGMIITVAPMQSKSAQIWVSSQVSMQDMPSAVLSVVVECHLECIQLLYVSLQQIVVQILMLTDEGMEVVCRSHLIDKTRASL